MNNIKELQGKINPSYDEVLSEIVAENDMPVIIWGATKICRQLINYINGKRPVVLWDSRLHGNAIKGNPIVKPQFDLPDEIKQNSYVIMAFTAEKNYVSCGKLLKDSSYHNCVNGGELLEHITASKVFNDYNRYKELNHNPDFEIRDDDLRLVTWQMLADAGSDFHDYEVLENIWAAKKICANKPAKHYDIGSSVKGFIAILVSAGIDTVLIDVRPLETAGIENLTFLQSDATYLSGIESDSIDSLSTLSVVEHIGLGRYNDTVDPDGHLKTMASIQRVLKKGGELFFSVPVSNRNYVQFNGHRAYMPEFIVEKFDKMELVEFSLASNVRGVIKNHPLKLPDKGEEFGYYMGLFHFRKK